MKYSTSTFYWGHEDITIYSISPDVTPGIDEVTEVHFGSLSEQGSSSTSQLYIYSPDTLKVPFMFNYFRLIGDL